jgi:hypothetical protein
LLASFALRRDPPRFRFRPAIRQGAALALAAYALVAYPLLGAAAGHGWVRGPILGVAPCPTTIFTLALLLLAERPSALLAAIPFAWSLLGLSAAVQLGIREDYGLAVAGVAAAALLALERARAISAAAADPATAAAPRARGASRSRRAAPRRPIPRPRWW